MSNSSTSVDSKEVADVQAGGAFNDSVKKHSCECAANLKCHRKGISHDEMVKNYNAWAYTYDADLRAGVYNGPEIIARIMAECYPKDKRPMHKVIDVAAGTGQVGEQLYMHGFRCIDALEPSEKMVEVARQRKIYENIFVEKIDVTESTIPSNKYDSVIISGGMGEGHIPTQALVELARIVKPGGSVYMAMREEYLAIVNDYNGKLEPFMRDMEAQNIWKQRVRKIVPNYSFNKNGVVFIFDVL